MSKKHMFTWSCILYSEFTPLTRDVTCPNFRGENIENIENRENIGDKKLSVEHTLLSVKLPTDQIVYNSERQS